MYPQAMTTLPGSSFWSALFFLMILTVGLDSQFGNLEAIITSIKDFFPSTRKYHAHVLGIICFVGFSLGLTMTTPGGPYLVTLIDDYCCAWTVLVIAFLECISISYIYGKKAWLIFIARCKLLIFFIKNFETKFWFRNMLRS